MHAVLQEAISAYNLPLTILLGLVALYWLATLVGLTDFDSLDGFFGLEDGAPNHGEEGGGSLHSLLKGLGFADAPLMFILTVFSLVLWGANVLGNIYMNASASGGIAAIILAGALVSAFLVTKLALRPLRPLMRLMRDTEKRVAIPGLTGVVRSLFVTSESGQVEVERDGASILLHARVAEGKDPLSCGEEVLVVMEFEGGGTYLVRPLLRSGHEVLPPPN